MANIFIAYSSNDIQFLNEFRSQLSDRSTNNIFVAAFSLQLGQEWRSEVEANLRKAHFFVPLISKSFLASREARRELSGAIELADEEKLTIIPVIIEDIERAELPLIVKATQYISFQPIDGIVFALLRDLDLSAGPLSSRSSLEVHVRTRNLTTERLIELARQVFDSSWTNAEKSKAIKFIADRLRNQRHPQEAVRLYDMCIELFPHLETLRVARADINLQLRNFQAADDDCAFVLQGQPNNLQALMKRFWINHTWATTKPTRDEAGDQVATMEACLKALHDNPASTDRRFLGSYLRALAEGATRLTREYADTAMKLLEDKRATIDGMNRQIDRVAVLEALKSLSQYCIGLGDSAAADNAGRLRAALENRWKLYDY